MRRRRRCGDRVRTAGAARAAGTGGGRGAGGPAQRSAPAHPPPRERVRGRGLLQGPREGAASRTIAPEPPRCRCRGARGFPARCLLGVSWERGWWGGAGGWPCSARSQTDKDCPGHVIAHKLNLSGLDCKARTWEGEDWSECGHDPFPVPRKCQACQETPAPA